MFATMSTYATDASPESVAVADINGDQRADIITANYASNDTSVLLNAGNGTFLPQTTYPTGNGPRAVAIKDILTTTVILMLLS